MVLELIKGVALLLALSLLQSFNVRIWQRNQTVEKITSGVLFGGICVIGMMTPIEVIPGVIFDARSVILSMSGLFGGPIVGVIAAIIAGSYRLWLGGGGVYVGVSVIVVCMCLGLAYRYCHQRGWVKVGVLTLLAFGLLVHGVEVLLFTQLPANIVQSVMDNVALPLILTFTPATALLGMMLQDIDKKAETENALRNAERRFRKYFEIGPVGIAETSPDKGWVRINDVTCDMLGYTRDELREKTWEELTHPDDLAKDKIQFERALAGEIDSYYLEKRFVRKDGSIIPTLLSVNCERKDDGSVNYFVAILQDITNLKKAEDDLINYQEHLEQLVASRTLELNDKAKRLEQALESEKKYSTLQRQFVSLVSHELRTPLSIIDGGVQRIIKRLNLDTPEKIRERGDKIRYAVDRMVGLIDTVLYAERLDEQKIPFNPAICDIKAIVYIASEHQEEISPNHEIQIDLDGLPPTIFADWKLLNHVLQNLLSNAVKYAPNNPLIEVKGLIEGDDAIISVTDHGVGIPEDDHPKMFQRFFRAKTSEGIPGTGIGLNVAKEFVGMHGGDITFDSIVGKKTTFTVRLPINLVDQ